MPQVHEGAMVRLATQPTPAAADTRTTAAATAAEAAAAAEAGRIVPEAVLSLWLRILAVQAQAVRSVTARAHRQGETQSYQRSRAPAV